MGMCECTHLGLCPLWARSQIYAAVPPPYVHTLKNAQTLVGILRVCEWLFHMHVAVLAFFPGAGPPGSAGEQGDGARVHFRPSACLCACIHSFKVEVEAAISILLMEGGGVCVCMCLWEFSSICLTEHLII